MSIVFINKIINLSGYSFENVNVETIILLAKKENIVKRNGTFDPHFDYSSELHFGASDIKVDETYEVAFKGTRLAYNLSEKTTLTFNDKESKVKDLIKARGMLTTIQSNPANLSKKQIDELSNRLSKINNQLEQLGVI